MGSKRPTDHLEPSAKRRNESQGRREDGSDDEPEEDPGNWRETNKASEEVLKGRKIFKARRLGGVAPSEPATPAENSSNGTAAAAGAPAEPPKSSNPFASVSLLSKPPAAGPAQPKPAEAEPSAPAAPAQAEAGSKDAVAPEADTHDEAVTSPAKPASSGAVATVEGSAASLAADKAADTPAAAPTSGEAQVSCGASAAAEQTGASDGGFKGGFSFGFNANASGKGFGALAGSASGSTGGFGGFGAAAAAAKGNGESDTVSGGLFGAKPAFAFGSSPDKDAAGPVPSVFGSTTAGAGPAASSAPASSAASLLKPEAGDGEVVTGEEEEQTVFSGDGTLFGFEADGWKERGRGELRVKLGKTGVARLIMRQRGNLRLLLNANLWEDMAVNVMDGALGVTFAVHNAADQDADGGKEDKEKEAAHAAAAGLKRELSTYAFRVKTKQALDSFKSAIEQHRKADAATANV